MKDCLLTANHLYIDKMTYFAFLLLMAGRYSCGKVVHREGSGTMGMNFGPGYDQGNNRVIYAREYDFSRSERESGESSGISGGGMWGLIGEHYGGYHGGFIGENDLGYSGGYRSVVTIRQGGGSGGGNGGGYFGGYGDGFIVGNEDKYKGGHDGGISDGISGRQRGGNRGGEYDKYFCKNNGGLVGGFPVVIDGVYRGRHAGSDFRGGYVGGLRDGIIGRQSGRQPSFSFGTGPRRIQFPM